MQKCCESSIYSIFCFYMYPFYGILAYKFGKKKYIFASLYWLIEF